MTCDKAFARYLELDKNERVPLQVTLHLIGCPACRTGVRRLTRAEHSLARPLSARTGAMPAAPAAEDAAVRAAMERIAASGLSYPDVRDSRGRVSMTRWVVAGCALVAGFAIMPASSMGEWSRLVFGDAYYLPFSILCGVAVTVFGGLFIGSNIDFFVKKFGFHPSI
ncbi:MAG TPA: hypothetical protein PK542_01145 [Treponemataceae bacterium]|nr:hypothetical protein [Treponemataceae bacterium]